MNEHIYDISYKKLVNILVPQVLRKPKMLALLSALIDPVVYIYNLFLINRRSNLYKLKITPQVCYVEMALNDKYDNSSRRIKIIRSKSHNPIYLYGNVEDKPHYLYRKTETDKPKTLLIRKSEASDFKTDFIVQIPKDVAFDENEIRAVIDNYILPDKKYEISTV